VALYWQSLGRARASGECGMKKGSSRFQVEKESSKFQVQGSRLKGNGVNRKGRQERQESPSLFFKEPASALLGVLGVLCGSSLCLCPSIRKRQRNGAHHRGHRAHRERPSLFFSRNQPLPSFAFLAFFAVEVFAVAVAVYSAWSLPAAAGT
jgi:hypothetical protein